MSAAAGAAAAAAAAAQRMREEEEEMTPYTPQDLTQDWEFKILRSVNAMFKRPDKLQAVLEEERRAGWVLVEKFDEGRIRLKRPASAKANDATLGFDAYRTRVGISEGRYVLTILGIVFGALALLLGAIALIVNLVK